MKLAIIGTGYVGLVTGACFAEMGNDVVCVDIDEAKLERLRAGVLPIYEPGLVVPVERGIKDGRLRFATDFADAVPEADVVFLTLPTPPKEDGSADLTYVKAATKVVASQLTGYTVIVSKSTVPVGSSDALVALISEGKPDEAEFDVVSNPEFLREGAAVDDFMRPERVIIGSSSERATEIMQGLYQPFVRSGNPVIVMDRRSAEMTKYAANSFLATKISFMNEVAGVCKRVGADVNQVRRGIGSDSRIGKKFLYAGIGFGGSCFPKDVMALSRTASDVGYDLDILQAVLRVNARQRSYLAERLIEYYGDNLRNRRIAVWGLAFKPNTDDVREAPALVVIELLLAAGAKVVAYDPEANDSTRVELGDRIEYATDAYSALEKVDALIICTEWNEFRHPDFEKMRGAMSNPVILDGRNLYDPRDVADNGFHYESIGRPTVKPLSSSGSDGQEDR
jgi:UDPglucose 6-dehydrogenase